MPPTGEPLAIAVLCHGTPSGYPDEPGDRGYPGFAEAIAAHGFEVWWFNFRGARDSEGVFTFEGWVRDLLGVLAEIPKGSLPLYVAGASAGGGVALTAAARSSGIDGVATLASPATWEKAEEDMLAEARRTGAIPPGYPIDPDEWWKEFFDNQPIHQVPALRGRPILIIHGEEDRAVDPVHAEQLLGAAKEPKRLVIVKGAGHQLRRNQVVIDALVTWFTDCAARKSGG
ncbi:MAG TPA: alpha/beta fold hydrolase [Actinomycetota bacterium]|nr:alpha/beta fold hydrolase [Actinomycetota bacterium]